MRILHGVAIRFEEKSSSLSVSDLIKSFGIAKSNYKLSDRRVCDILATHKFKLILYDLLSDRGLITIEFDEFTSIIDKKKMIGFLKDISLWNTKGKGASKNSYCLDIIWKILYVNMFNDFSEIDCPRWIKDIDASISKYSAGRVDSMECNFIDKLIRQSAIINSNVIRQFKIDSYYYDLRINILDKPFLIEYNESYHSDNKQIQRDFLKYQLAIENGFAYLSIPYNKEDCQFEYIRHILTNNLSIEEVNDNQWFRFNSLLSDNIAINSIVQNPDYQKYARAINERVFGFHQTGMRNLASAKQLALIAEIERFVIQSIRFGLIKTESVLLPLIKNYQVIETGEPSANP